MSSEIHVVVPGADRYPPFRANSPDRSRGYERYRRKRRRRERGAFRVATDRRRLGNRRSRQHERDVHRRRARHARAPRRPDVGATGVQRSGDSPNDTRRGRAGATRKLDVVKDIVDRYFSDDAPESMSPRTGLIRTLVKERRERGDSLLVEAHPPPSRRSSAPRRAGCRCRGHGRVAGTTRQRVARGRGRRVLHDAGARVGYPTPGGGERARSIDPGTPRAPRGPIPGPAQDAGHYSSRTPADVQLIDRTVHRLGESEATVPKGFVDEVRKYITKWDSAQLQSAFARASAQKLGPRVSDILLQHHLPREFFYLALQESNFDPRAIGPSTRFGVPKGLWQIIPPTAKGYGLRLGPLQGERRFDPSDERHDVAKSTTAAARYLEDIYTTDAQASGLLVMASYNMGETRLIRLIRSMPESPAQRNFWALLAKHRQGDSGRDVQLRVPGLLRRGDRRESQALRIRVRSAACALARRNAVRPCEVASGRRSTLASG